MVSGQTSRLEVVSASLCQGGVDVRFGSKADIERRPADVRFTPNSGHSSACVGCPLSAKSGLMHCSNFVRYSTTSSAVVPPFAE
jgi:hypothetical protein